MCARNLPARPRANLDNFRPDPVHRKGKDIVSKCLFLDQTGMNHSSSRVDCKNKAYKNYIHIILIHRFYKTREVYMNTLKIVGLKRDDYNKNVKLVEFKKFRFWIQFGIMLRNKFRLTCKIDKRLLKKEVVYQSEGNL
jgi:hypothetical protein